MVHRSDQHINYHQLRKDSQREHTFTSNSLAKNSVHYTTHGVTGTVIQSFAYFQSVNKNALNDNGTSNKLD